MVSQSISTGFVGRLAARNGARHLIKTALRP
jgi:hypothetical protein